jgi:hypothetical protein
LKWRAKATCEAIRRQERSRFWCVVSFPIPIRRCALVCLPRWRRPWLCRLHRSWLILVMVEINHHRDRHRTGNRREARQERRLKRCPWRFRGWPPSRRPSVCVLAGAGLGHGRRPHQGLPNARRPFRKWRSSARLGLIASVRTVDFDLDGSGHRNLWRRGRQAEACPLYLRYRIRTAAERIYARL